MGDLGPHLGLVFARVLAIGGHVADIARQVPDRERLGLHHHQPQQGGIEQRSPGRAGEGLDLDALVGDATAGDALQHPLATGIVSGIGVGGEDQAPVGVGFVDGDIAQAGARQDLPDADVRITIPRPQPLGGAQGDLAGLDIAAPLHRRLLRRGGHELAQGQGQQGEHQAGLEGGEEDAGNGHAGGPHGYQFRMAGQRPQAHQGPDQGGDGKEVVGVARQAQTRHGQGVAEAIDLPQIVHLVGEEKKGDQGEQHRHRQQGAADHGPAQVSIQDLHARFRRRSRSAPARSSQAVQAGR